MRGPLYLVAVSTCGDTVEYLWEQLHYLHAQIISILTSKVEQIFARNASFDLRGLLGGTDRVIRSMIRYANSEPSLLFNAVPCLRVPAAARAELAKVLSNRPADTLFAVMIARCHLVQLAKAKRSVLHPQVGHLPSAGARYASAVPPPNTCSPCPTPPLALLLLRPAAFHSRGPPAGTPRWLRAIPLPAPRFRKCCWPCNRRVTVA